MKSFIKILLLLIAGITLNAQDFIRAGEYSKDLSNDILRLYEENEDVDNFWIGYSIENLRKNDVAVGTFYFKNNGDFSLKDLLSGKINYEKYESLHSKSRFTISGRSIRILNVKKEDDNKYRSERTAILIRYDRNSVGVDDFAEIVICKTSYFVDLAGYQLNWIGDTEKQMSAEYLIQTYTQSNNWYIKEELIPAIAIHFGVKGITDFLIGEYNASTDQEKKEDLLFWIGVQDNNKAYSFLNEIVDNESSKLAEAAVMGIGYVSTDEALDRLIEIARTHFESEVREHAIYSLSHKAVKKAEQALKNVIENDPDVEIKKTAIYALTNSEGDNIEYLIDIAKNHPSLELRKTAIYSLSNSEDERAVQTIISLARGEK